MCKDSPSTTLLPTSATPTSKDARLEACVSQGIPVGIKAFACPFTGWPLLHHYLLLSGMYDAGPWEAPGLDVDDCSSLVLGHHLLCSNLPSQGLSHLPLSPCKEICLASVESDFNISKVNENVDGSYDYGIFQINSHHWCHISHSENICHIDCKDLLTTDLIGAINCAKKILSKRGGMRNWARRKLHCEGRPLSYWITGCRLK
ncbi:lysozyme C-like [Suncus etruscus]|uniref:lysozyme C-like n=1 Tax=Suncus etruscus TaxID=109475 RepID=UPI00210FB43A|nr:lysozyme C-like [Suncus etruscus]